MITLYYIGGPWDLIKRASPAEPVPVITIRQYVGTGAYCGDMAAGVVRNPNDTADIAATDHRYFTRQIGRETFIAIHAGIGS